MTAAAAALDLRGERAIPDAVWDRADLLRLVVADMALTVLPSQLGRLRALTTLDAAHNALGDVPEALGELSSL